MLTIIFSCLAHLPLSSSNHYSCQQGGKLEKKNLMTLTFAVIYGQDTHTNSQDIFLIITQPDCSHYLTPWRLTTPKQQHKQLFDKSSVLSHRCWLYCLTVLEHITENQLHLVFRAESERAGVWVVCLKRDLLLKENGAMMSDCEPKW